MSGIKISSRNIPKGNSQGERREGGESSARIFTLARKKKEKKATRPRRVHVVKKISES